MDSGKGSVRLGGNPRAVFYTMGLRESFVCSERPSFDL
jgi:hypothetical protein